MPKMTDKHRELLLCAIGDAIDDLDERIEYVESAIVSLKNNGCTDDGLLAAYIHDKEELLEEKKMLQDMSSHWYLITYSRHKHDGNKTI